MTNHQATKIEVSLFDYFMHLYDAATKNADSDADRALWFAFRLIEDDLREMFEKENFDQTLHKSFRSYAVPSIFNDDNDEILSMCIHSLIAATRFFWFILECAVNDFKIKETFVIEAKEAPSREYRLRRAEAKALYFETFEKAFTYAKEHLRRDPYVSAFRVRLIDEIINETQS